MGVHETSNWKIDESGLSRLIGRLDHAKDAAIMTAYRATNDEKTNIQRLKSLRAALNLNHMGAYELVGYFKEKGQPKASKERSYAFVKPEGMSREDFDAFIVSQLKRWNQDAALVKIDTDYVLMDQNGDTDKIGSRLDLGKAGDAYSRMVGSNLPFTFEGVSVPVTNYGKMHGRIRGYLWE